MVATLLHTTMPVLWYYILPASVWVVYTLDHLLDAQRIHGRAHTPRHHFHRKYAPLLWRIWALVALSCVSALWLPRSIVIFGIGMCVLVGIHLLLVAYIRNRISKLLIKELGVGIVYSLGVWGPILMLPAPWRLHHVEWIAFAVQFFLIAMLNLFVFSLYDMAADVQDGHTSFVQAIGKRASRWLMAILGSVILLGCGIWVAEYPLLQSIYALMTLLLLWIALDERRFRPHELFRMLGDGVFLLPVLYALFA